MLFRVYEHITLWKQRETVIQQGLSLLNDKDAQQTRFSLFYIARLDDRFYRMDLFSYLMKFILMEKYRELLQDFLLFID